MQGYLGISKILANFGIPLSVFLFFSSNELIQILYEPQWDKSILVFQILSISIRIQMLQSSTGGFFQSANRTDLLLLLLSTTINIIGIVTGVYLGSIYWVAVMIVITFSLNFFQTNYLLLNRSLKTSALPFYKGLIKPIIIGTMEIVAFLILPEVQFGSILNLIIKGGLFVLILIFGLAITGQYKDFISLLK